jgi:hypothetical protein
MTLIFQKIQILLFVCMTGTIPQKSFSQTALDADGPGNTYELINSILAPGYNAVENPECVHPEFGRHIAEVWDADLKQYVFEFYMHVTPDNDRCINFDRQRVEIKTYESSPDNLKGVVGETVIYKWKFRVPVGFQPSSSFTHIHQVKAVGGDEGDPIFTLTPRKGTPNKMELIHNNTTKVATMDLSNFEGTWVEATERIKIDPLHGSYTMTIKKVADGSSILSYTNNDLMTIRPDNSFIRPKWGIYRSLNSPALLRDEAMRFAGFSIAEEKISASKLHLMQVNNGFQLFPNPASKNVTLEYNLNETTDVQIIINKLDGSSSEMDLNHELQPQGNYQKCIDVSGLKEGIYLVSLSTGTIQQTKKLCIKK